MSLAKLQTPTTQLPHTHKPKGWRSPHSFTPYTTIRERIDMFLVELNEILKICTKTEREQIWFILQEIFGVYQHIYPISPQLPQFLIRNRQKRNLRRIAMVISRLPPENYFS
jgi:hypothetical protein